MLMRVYKFLSADIAQKVIAERRLKISTFSEMNDPFELLGIVLTAAPHAVEFLEYFKTQTFETLKRQTGAICFSERWVDPVLWAHYADQHKGIALGFELDPSEDVGARRVAYVAAKQERNITELLERLAAVIGADRQEQIKVMEAGAPLFEEILCTKFDHWAYEQEVRAFCNLHNEEGGKFFLNFQEAIKLKEVILGVRCAIEPTPTLAQLAGFNTDIKVIQATASEDAFAILEDSGKTVVHSPH